MGRSRRERERRQKQAAAALQALLKRARRVCRTLNSIERWRALIAEVRHVFQQWEEDLPHAARLRLVRTLEQAEQVQGRLELACRILQKDIQGAIAATAAPATHSVLRPVLIGVSAVVVGVGVAVVFMLPGLMERGMVVIQVSNQCDQPLQYSAPAGFFGGSIDPHAATRLDVPALEVGVGRGEGGIRVSFLVGQFHFQADPGAVGDFNGEPILPGFQGGFDLSEHEEHHLVITCP